MFFKYQIACRDCFTIVSLKEGNSTPNGIQYATRIPTDYEDIIFKQLQDQTLTDFKAQFWIYKTLKWQCECIHNGIQCNSNNAQIVDLKIYEEKLYDFNRLVNRCKTNNEYMLSFWIEDIGSRIELRPGGSQHLSATFYRNSIKKIIEFINKNSFIFNEKLITSPDNKELRGIFSICVTGKVSPKIETFHTRGFTKNELLTIIKPLIDKADGRSQILNY